MFHLLVFSLDLVVPFLYVLRVSLFHPVDLSLVSLLLGPLRVIKRTGDAQGV